MEIKYIYISFFKFIIIDFCCNSIIYLYLFRKKQALKIFRSKRKRYYDFALLIKLFFYNKSKNDIN